MDYEEFYARCAQLLNTEHDFRQTTGPIERPRHDGTIRNTHKNRWNDREPGNGRFPGHGLVRHFGRVVHVNLRNPRLWGIFPTDEAALAAIAAAMECQ